MWDNLLKEPNHIPQKKCWIDKTGLNERINREIDNLSVGKILSIIREAPVLIQLKDNSLITESSDEEKVRMKWAREVLHKLENTGTIEHFLTDEQIKAIRVAEYALDELSKEV